MTVNLAMNIVCVTVAPPGLAWFWSRVSWRFRARFYRSWIGAAAGGAASYAFQRSWLWFLLAAANAGVAVVLWWLSRRRKRRAPRAYGAKSALLVAALVRRARDAARPRPVPRLGPAGARL